MGGGIRQAVHRSRWVVNRVTSMKGQAGWEEEHSPGGDTWTGIPKTNSEKEGKPNGRGWSSQQRGEESKPWGQA